MYAALHPRLRQVIFSSHIVRGNFFFSRLFPSLCVRSPRKTHRHSPRRERERSRCDFYIGHLPTPFDIFERRTLQELTFQLHRRYSFNRILPLSFRFHREIVFQGENSPTFSTRVHGRLCVGNSTHAYRHNARNRSSCDFSRGNRAIFTGALSIIQHTVHQGLDARPILSLPIVFAPPRLLYADRPDMFYSQVASPATS